jgi:methyl coenzyme M reductase subunit D
MSSYKQHKDLKPIQHIINMQILKEYEKNRMISIASDKNNLKVSTGTLIHLPILDLDTAKTIAASIFKNEYAVLVHRFISSQSLEQLNVN